MVMMRFRVSVHGHPAEVANRQNHSTGFAWKQTCSLSKIKVCANAGMRPGHGLALAAWHRAFRVVLPGTCSACIGCNMA